MKRFVLTLGANQDLDEIDEYLAREFGNVVAERQSEKLFQAFELIASQPNMGSSRTAWTDEDVLFWPVVGTPNLIVYRRGDPVVILRIWNGRRDPTKLEQAIQEGRP